MACFGAMPCYHLMAKPYYCQGQHIVVNSPAPFRREKSQPTEVGRAVQENCVTEEESKIEPKE